MSAIIMNAGSTNGMWFFFLALIGSERKEPCRTNKTSSYLCLFSSVRVFKKCKREEKEAKKDKSRKSRTLSSTMDSAFFSRGHVSSKPEMRLF